jgi:hypothetical protein
MPSTFVNHSRARNARFAEMDSSGCPEVRFEEVYGFDLLERRPAGVERSNFRVAGQPGNPNQTLPTTPFSRDLLISYERGLYEDCALHAGDPHWGGMIAERKPYSAHNSSLLVTWNFRVPPR